MPIYALKDKRPRFPRGGSYWVAPSAEVIGNVELGNNVSIWFGATLRGDNDRIEIGAGSNVQEHAMLHTDPGLSLRIGEGCTIGHHAVIHGSTIGDNTLIGIGATVLNNAQIGANCLVGAGALVTEGKVFPDGSLIVGAPAKVMRPLSEAEINGLRMSARTYVNNWKRFATELVELTDVHPRDFGTQDEASGTSK